MFGQNKEKKKVVEFHYKDKVEVIEGFYSGQIGILVDKTTDFLFHYGRVTQYQIRLSNNNSTLVWVYEEEIKKRT